jgi:hypothetical protein
MLLPLYCLISVYLFRIWFNHYKQDLNLSNEDKILCLVTLVIGAVLWPIVLPIAYSKLLNRQKYRTPIFKMEMIEK